MTTAKDVIAYMEQRLPEASEFKLCKLAYYAQAWNVVWSGHELFDDRIEAWRHGPVPAECWRQRTRAYGPKPQALSPAERNVVDAVLDHYGRLSAPELWTLSHMERPWREARGDLPDTANSEAEITVRAMRRFYTQLSSKGRDTPKKPAQEGSTPSPSVLELADREAKRWSGTLERLAHR
ncbi:MAG: DUF4065 domain-containing protein [Pseudonocardiaceae bacterium]|nr:DUF4065 domain-containing protein [Pseudonocardiaceae bacterium]